MIDRPAKIEGAPGLKWIRRLTGWEAYWRPRNDLVQRGYPSRSTSLWKGATPDAVPDGMAIAYIQTFCENMQAEMLVWSRGGLPEVRAFDGTLRSLIRCYETDPDSAYHGLRYQSRRNSDFRCKHLILEHGDQPIGDTIGQDGTKIDGIRARMILRWHENWADGGKIAKAHSMIAMLRTLMGFGATFLEDPECARVRGVLSGMKFKMTKPRAERLTADQANAIRAAAHAKGLHSLALAQAFQFEVMLRQKDVIGEWVPTTEKGLSDVVSGNSKWMCGLRWSEIDASLILRHLTSKRQKEIEFDLKLAPMVIEELGRLGPLPMSGPVIVFEKTDVPYVDYQFRREWRDIRKALGISAKVFNMDSRSGAISEATDAGAPLEHVRHAATHSNISTTQGYSRGGTEKTAEVARLRVEHRNKDKP